MQILLSNDVNDVVEEFQDLKGILIERYLSLSKLKPKTSTETKVLIRIY